MDGNWLPLAAFILTAIGWLSRELWRWRKAKGQAAHDASETLKDKKTLLEEMISKIEDASQKEELQLQLDEVNAALLGLQTERLRRTLKDAGFPPEEILTADGQRQLKPQESVKIEKIISEVNVLPPILSVRDLLLLGSAYYLLEKYEKAKNIYSKIIDANPYDHDALQFRGTAYIRLKKYEEALADFNRALELKPNDYVALHDRGVVFRNIENYKDSLDDFNHALKLKPDHPVILHNRGVTYLRMGKYEDGLADFNRSLEIEPNNPNVLYDLACLLSAWGKTDDAITNLEKAINGDGKNREEAKTDEDFENVRNDPRFRKLIGID